VFAKTGILPLSSQNKQASKIIMSAQSCLQWVLNWYILLLVGISGYESLNRAQQKTMDYFERKLDEKNRLTIPKQLRAEFGDNIIITPGFKNYIHVYPESVWNDEMEEALKGDILDETKADLNVRFRIGKTVAELDSKQGRITLEAHHMALLDGKKDIVAVRAGKYFRITAK